MINIFSERKYFLPTYTIGRMSIRGIFSCDTLEDPVRDYNKDGDLNDPGEDKIPGKTAIPYGRYKVEVRYSPKFKRKIPWIFGVNNFTNIRIHALNWHWQTDGCIGVGENKVIGGLIHSRETENILTALLLGYQKAGEEIYINVI